jgi:uncharacterized protein (TIGR03083 family)
MPLEPLQPIHAADRFAGLGDELIRLLRSLTPEQWNLPTVCPAWTVQDIAAHLLDTACRRLSSSRDGHRPPPPETPVRGYGDLVAFLDGLNAQWVGAARRLSPRLLTDLLEILEPQLAEHLSTLDPWGPALPVAWAGETESRAWFDVARELTERWHHQQQIRLAVGAPPLDDPWWSEPVFDAFIRALPYRYREVDAPGGAALAVRIEGRRPYRYTLRRDGPSWILLRGEAPRPAAKITLDEQTAWLLFTKGIRPDEARAKAVLEGEPRLAAPYFQVLSVMA